MRRHRAYQQLGAALRAARHRRGLSITVTANLIGSQHATLQSWETGFRLPEPGVILALAEVLQTDPVPLLWCWLRDRVGDDVTALMLGPVAKKW